jgi:hypothetical protein
MPKKPRPRVSASLPAPTPAQEKLSLDTQLVGIYLMGLQSEVEAKLRRVAKFREQMRKIDAAGGRTDRAARAHAARVLIGQINEMLVSNLTVRDTLAELLKAAETLLDDLRQEATAAPRDGSRQIRAEAPAGNPGARSKSAVRRVAAATTRKG